MGIATFNSILQHMRNRNADSTDDDIFEDELHHSMRRLNFAEEQDEAKDILSDLRSIAEKQKTTSWSICFWILSWERDARNVQKPFVKMLLASILRLPT